MRIVGLMLLLGNFDVACVGESKLGDGRAGKFLLRSRVGEVGVEDDDSSDLIGERGDGERDG